ncbi:N-acetylmuramoyl-L-alanine amidase [Thorsellia anophelis]|uniref:N-acetylmuramoyl-L-alanine amidase n=1 Tax=Thorsellia anophelis DSM 18579 TaxID=1123402 RepID=A0A1I0BDF1_9GAMM|nr:N-acetylmuramoyl-L-alanine amidase [Thorsellia anophelis]SET04217.1 N-acetylmuramoyl-L-alanine amidase [Thorsellia anophelis DSM 18579]
MIHQMKNRLHIAHKIESCQSTFAYYAKQVLLRVLKHLSSIKQILCTLIYFLLFVSLDIQAGYLVNLSYTNQTNDASLTLTFDSEVKPKFALVSDPIRLVIDLNANNGIQGLPVSFNGLNLMKGIESVKANGVQTRLSVPLSRHATVNHALKKQNGKYILTIQLSSSDVQDNSSKAATNIQPKEDLGAFIKQSDTVKEPKVAAQNKPVSPAPVSKNVTNPPILKPKQGTQSGKIVIAIDAGHGGKDPGAIGSAGHKEKVIALAVSKKLEKLLNDDPMFSPVLTRTGDYYISVPDRSEIARKQKANLLVSIHADAAPNKEARGASVWVLSNKRANNEMAGWLEKQEKQSELLGGAGDVLSGNYNDKYLSQAVIDLQFGHSQKVGYGAAQEVLKDLGKIGKLHKKKPEHASLGVLRSPDIPSLLVEIGFISNKAEEHLLATPAYQDKLAQSIYKGLKRYFEAHPVNTSASDKIVSDASKGSSSGNRKHKVKKGDSLSKIAEKYHVKPSAIKKANKMEDDNVMLDQTLIIPD